MDLAGTKHGLTAAALARRRNLSVRTVYRDLHALEDAGFPIAMGTGARWKLIDGWDSRVPFPLPAGQLLALHTARSLMAPIRRTPVGREFDLLYQRLVGTLRDEPGSQGQLFPRLRAVLATRSQLAIDYAAHEAVIETLCRAAETHTTVKAVYYSDSRRELTRRKIDPYSLYYDPQLEALYVFGWCHTRREVRTFAVHRFRQATRTQQQFQPPSGFTAENYLRGAFRLWRGENTTKIRLLIDPEAAGWVTERRWHASQETTKRKDGSCEISFSLDGLREIERFVLQLGSSVEVIEPASLRRQIALEQARAARRNSRRPQERVTLGDTEMRKNRAS